MEEREKDNLGFDTSDLSIFSDELKQNVDEVISIDDSENMEEANNDVIEANNAPIEEIPESNEVIEIQNIASEEVPLNNEVIEEQNVVVEEAKKPTFENDPSIFDDEDDNKSIFVNENIEVSPASEQKEYVPHEEEKPVEHKTEVKTESTKGFKKYFSYEDRIIKYSFMFVLFFLVGSFLIFKSININGEEYINYTETSNLDYKVYLKKNDFYEEKFLGKDMLYVASLIDNIDIDFLYNFNISEQVDLNFKYNISGVLSIMDAEGKKTYLTKSYELLPEKTFSLKGTQDHTITENIKVDYDGYNKLASSFKSTYGLDTTSKLQVFLNIDKTSSNENIKDLEKADNMLIEIPLSQKSVSISMDYKDINRNSKLVKSSSVSIKNMIMTIIGVVVLLISVFALYNVIKLLGLLGTKKSKYDKYINRLMRQYDRLIVVHYTCPDLSNYNVVKIKEFNELLDMRDNLKVPIMYYNVTDHQKSYFYIINNNDLYLLVLKSVDFEK